MDNEENRPVSIDDGRYGRLEQAGERWRLRFTRQLAHPPTRVWRALTEPEQLAAWFPQRIVGEWAVGATLRFVSAGQDGSEFSGAVLVYDPPSVLEFTWGTDHLRFEIEPDGEGSILVLLDTFDPLGKAARDAAGWHTCLDLLDVHLSGDTPSWKPGERWQEVNPHYIQRFGPEASTIGPPSRRG